MNPLDRWLKVTSLVFTFGDSGIRPVGYRGDFLAVFPYVSEMFSVKKNAMNSLDRLLEMTSAESDGSDPGLPKAI